MKGIVLAGGAGTRLHPVTMAVCKQLLPVYDKPMIYYPMSVLMLAGIRDILIISTPLDLPLMERLFGDGSHLGLNLSYAEQDQPRGLAEALIIGEPFLDGSGAALVLGDNVFHGPGFAVMLQQAVRENDGCTLFGYGVSDPERFGVAEVDAEGRLLSIEEKPEQPKSNRAITGLYLYDSQGPALARELRPSARGELEITDLNIAYIHQRRARMIDLGRGFAWLDTGTHASLLQAAQFVQVMETRTGVRIACLEEIALRMGFIDAETCYARGEALSKSAYGQYVMEVARATRTGAPV